jgi:Tol biopolymer transport system component
LGLRLRVAVAVIGFAALAAASPALATFHGANGKIAFVHSAPGNPLQIYTMNPDGTDRTPLTSGPARNYSPEWSPDGSKIAFSSDRDDPNPGICTSCNTEIYVMDANGGNVLRRTTDPSLDPSLDGSPHWSPDGTKITFDSTRTGGGDIYSMNADGSGVVRLTTTASRDEDPAWSPDGGQIAFTNGTELRRMNLDGTSQTPVTTGADQPSNPDWSPDGTTIAYQQHACCDPRDNSQEIHAVHLNGTGDSTLVYGTAPSWSPDGSRIAVGYQECQSSGNLYFCGDKDIATMNPDGTGWIKLTNNGSGAASGEPSWQPIPETYVRPKGATPLRASLVPAFKTCPAPNESHGSPLAFGSCKPPEQVSSYLTVGTPDVNGQGSRASGSVLMKAFSCNSCAGPGPNADVTFELSITDVRKKSDLSDYTGQLRADTSLRITDRNNTPNPGPGPGTVSDTHFPFAVACTATVSTTIGSACAVSTSANAVMPGVLVATQRAVWQLGEVEVYDGGTSGTAGASDATLFMTQGIFIP